jgi:hypothetical protein
MKTRLLPFALVPLLLAAPEFAQAQTAPFTYQGRLASNSVAVNGTYDLTFGLCTNVSLGAAVGTVLTNAGIVISNGQFTTTLSFTNNFDGTAYWLEIGVRTNAGGAFITLSPRQQITPTPYAITASNLSGPLPAGQLTGSLPAGVLAGLYATAVNFTNAGNSFKGNGSGLTNLPAAQLSGTIPDARLSTNVALLNGTNQPGSSVVFSVPLSAIINNAANYALVGENVAPDGTSTGSGIFAATSQSAGTGLYAQNKDANGTGIIAAGNNQSGLIPANGAGLAAYGLTTAIYAQANSTSVGVPFAAINTFTPGLNYQVLVNYYDGSAGWKIKGNGTMSTLVADAANNTRVMFAPEAPEVLFEDYGSGQLTNGSAHIALDPIFAANIAVGPAHPLRAFVQLEGDCKGVYVANKTPTGFDVVELGGGTSSVPFTWHAVGNRADEEQIEPTKAADGTLNPKMVSHFSTQRFPIDSNMKTKWHPAAVQPATQPAPQN